ncbi:MAG TPA: Crp/Fnr family transcriptional regulator, partial [Rhizomicrobium sp.]|nr:Crp/Fnr family transcriptional regulator [Rhizomicrobium sp.]
AASFVRRYADGEAVLLAGVTNGHLACIVKGSLMAQRTFKNGRTVLNGYLIEEQVTGHLAVLDGDPPAFDAIANGEVDIVHVPGTAFMNTVSNDPALLMIIIQSLCRRTRIDYESLVMRIGNSTACQVAKLISYWARGAPQNADGSYDLGIGITQDQIAAQLGRTRQTVNRVLTQMVQDGVLARSYGQIRIADMKKLNAIIAEESPAPRYVLPLFKQPEGVLKGGD